MHPHRNRKYQLCHAQHAIQASVNLESRQSFRQARFSGYRKHSQRCTSCQLSTSSTCIPDTTAAWALVVKTGPGAWQGRSQLKRIQGILVLLQGVAASKASGPILCSAAAAAQVLLHNSRLSLAASFSTWPACCRLRIPHHRLVEPSSSSDASPRGFRRMKRVRAGHQQGSVHGFMCSYVRRWLLTVRSSVLSKLRVLEFGKTADADQPSRFTT